MAVLHENGGTLKTMFIQVRNIECGILLPRFQHDKELVIPGECSFYAGINPGWKKSLMTLTNLNSIKNCTYAHIDMFGILAFKNASVKYANV